MFIYLTYTHAQKYRHCIYVSAVVFSSYYCYFKIYSLVLLSYLTLLRMNKTTSALTTSMTPLLALLLLGLLSAKFPDNYHPLIFILPNSEYGFLLGLALKFILALQFRKTLFQLLFIILSIHIFHLASILCILVFQNWCHCCTQHCPQWLHIFLIIPSNDVPRNLEPPFHDCFFNSISWNVNSIAKDDFQRVRIIEAHNSIFKYDRISICETRLNDSIKLPDIVLYDYTFVHSKNPTNTRHGGVGLFYKKSLPIKIRNYLFFDESIVIELNFSRKRFSLQRYIEVLPLVMPLLSSKYSCQTLQIYIPKSKTKIHTRPFSLVILMATHISGGLMTTQLLRVGKLKIL